MSVARPCPACHSRVSGAFGDVGGFQMQQCVGCQTVFVARLPSADEEQDYRTYYSAENLEVPAVVFAQLDEFVSTFEADRRLNRWLDVGFGAGALMQVAASHGWNVTGTEVAPGAVEAVREMGFDVHLGRLNELNLEEESFDVVSVIEVLEHVPDPGALLSTVSRLLRWGGRLWLTTPHGRGISARLLRARWSAISPPEHLQLFSTTGLRLALKSSGLVARTVRTHATNPHELLQALMNPRAGGRYRDRVETSYRLNEALTGSRSGLLLRSTANALLNASRLGDSIKLTAERGSVAG